MYYDNKSSFYFKQYGVPILAIALSIVLIGVGSFLYWSSSTSNASNQDMVVASNELEDVNKVAVEILGKSLANLKLMQTSDEGVITEVKDDGSIIFKLNEMAVDIQLIGIDTTNISDNYFEVLKEDLVNKTATIAFDKQKIVDDKVYVYVYVDGSLYNEHVLESGLANLRKETVNTTLYDRLKQAQAYAKQLSKGIWKKN